MKKLAVFDLDGTLVNSIFDLAVSTDTALRQFGLPTRTLDEYYSFVGNGMETLVRSAMGDSGADEAMYARVRSVFDREYDRHCNDKTQAYPGVAGLLDILGNNGVMTAVLSNKAEEYINKILSKNFPNHHFAAAYGQREGIARKPDSQGLDAMLAALGTDKSDCVYIGDSEVDVMTAKNAGVDMIAVLWGYRTRDELTVSGAESFAADTAELSALMLGR